MRGIVEQVVTAGVWRGTGADAFVDEVSNLHLPSSNIAKGHINTFAGNLVRAAQVMEEADKKAQEQVHQVADIFRKIFTA